MDGYNPKWRGKVERVGNCERGATEKGHLGGRGGGVGPKPDRPTSMLPRAGFRSRGPCLAEVACSGPAHAPASTTGHLQLATSIGTYAHTIRAADVGSGSAIEGQICSAAISVKAVV